jgi:CheY-like chemotaxis protein
MRAPILIVEDNPDTREVLERVLAIRGYDVITTRDGVAALGYLRKGGRPAAIILDIAMPQMDGIAFSRELRADVRWADIPVIVYTAMPMKSIPTAAGVFRKGTDDPQRLLDLLAGICSTKH